jgi:hypothetical protein
MNALRIIEILPNALLTSEMDTKQSILKYTEQIADILYNIWTKEDGIPVLNVNQIEVLARTCIPAYRECPNIIYMIISEENTPMLLDIEKRGMVHSKYIYAKNRVLERSNWIVKVKNGEAIE